MRQLGWKKADKEVALTGRAISTDILDILRKVLLKYLAASFAISASLNPTKPIRRLGMTWESVTWKREEKCFPRSSLDRVGGSPETNTLVFSILSVRWNKNKSGCWYQDEKEKSKLKRKEKKKHREIIFFSAFYKSGERWQWRTPRTHAANPERA